MLPLCLFVESHPVSEMNYTVSSGTLNSTIPYHTVAEIHKNTRPIFKKFSGKVS